MGRDLELRETAQEQTLDLAGAVSAHPSSGGLGYRQPWQEDLPFAVEGHP